MKVSLTSYDAFVKMAVMGTVVDRIIAKFGNASRMARIMGLSPTTVQYWKEQGLIPKAKTQHAVMAAAKREGIDLSPADFFEKQ